MGERSGRVDLLVIADSPERQDLPALLESSQRALSAHDVPSLLLTYGTRRIEQRPLCGIA